MLYFYLLIITIILLFYFYFNIQFRPSVQIVQLYKQAQKTCIFIYQKNRN